jgi:hypothetical protein
MRFRGVEGLLALDEIVAKIAASCRASSSSGATRSYRASLQRWMKRNHRRDSFVSLRTILIR